jgi:autotransporter-associated beta strand protein
MKPKSLSLLIPSIIVCASAATSQGQVLSVATGQWDTAATWADAAVPSSGKNYKIDGENVNAPNVASGTAIRTFAGDALEVSSGELQLKVEHSGGITTGNYTIPGLSLSGGSLVFDASNGSTAWNLNSPIQFQTGTNSKLILRDGNFETSANIKEAITGSGNIAFEADRSDTNDDRANLNVQSANNTFSGNWSAQGFDTGNWANIRAAAVNALGTGVVTLLDRGSLQLDVANGIDSLSGVTLSHATARLNLNGRSWTSPSAALTVTTGNVNAGSALMTIASVNQTGGAINFSLNASSNGKLITSGAATFSGGVINATPTVNPAGKSYDIISYGSLVGTPTLAFGDLGRVTATVDYGSGTNDTVSVSFANAAANLVWTGNNVGFENNWDKEVAMNFSNGGTPDRFFSYDNVTFGNTTGSTTPNVIGNLLAGTVTFDHATNDYTLGGTGSLTGLTTLVKTGTGKLTIINPNSYTGTTTINGGILEVGNGGTTGTLGSGAVINDAQLVINRSDAVTLANVISGTGALTKSGTNTLILTGNNTYSGATSIPAGTLQIGNAGTSGTLGSGSITNSGAIVFNRTNNFTVSGLISGIGTVTQSGTGTTTLTAANDYSGLTSISAGKLAFSGGNNRIPATNIVAFSATSAMDIGAGDQTLAALTLPVANADSSTTITGSGTLTINGTVPFNFGVSGVSGVNITVARTATMNMTGLAAFVFDSSTQVFRVGAQPGVSTSGSGVPNGTFQASNNTSITALSFLLADQAGSGTGGAHTFRMGEATAINANTINLGASGRSSATLNFNTGLTAPKATFRATNGRAAVTSWEVGRVAHFGTNTWTATADFSTGELDALVTNLRIGITNPTNQSNRAGTQNGSFLMGKGSLVATNLVVGEHSGTGSANNTYAANGTFTLNHADGTVTATSLRLAENLGSVTGGTRSVSGTFNLQAGKLIAGEIRRGNQTATSPATVTTNFNWSGGTIQNPSGANLTISSLPVNLTGTNNPTFEATAGQSITLAADAAISGTGFGFTKAGAGTLTLSGTNTYSGNTWLDAGTLAGSGAANSLLTAISGTTLAPGSGVGTFAAAGAVLEPGSTLAIEIDSSTGAADRLVSSAPVDITGASISFTQLGSDIIPAGTKLTLIDYTGTALSGTFSSYAEGASITVGDNQFTLSYVDSSKVTLTSTTSASPYATWASASGLDGSAGKDPAFDADSDGDGFDNGLEWILGGNPLAADGGTLVTTTASASGGLTLAFNREEDSVGNATLTVEYDTDLVGPWATFATVGPTSASPVTIDTAGTPDAVSVNIPATNAVGGKLFGRLKATQP